MEIDLVHLIKSTKLFSSLDEKSIRLFLHEFEKVYIHQGQVLFRQGSPSDSLYIVVTGRLLLTLQTDGNISKVINEILPGQTFGELGLLSHEPRAMTAKAIDDSILLKLSSDNFYKLFKENTAVSLGIIQAFVTRSKNYLQLLSTTETADKHIIIAPANKNIKIEVMSNNLLIALKDKSDIKIISDFDPEFKEKYPLSIDVQNLISSAEAKGSLIIYIVESTKSTLAKLCFKRVDKIYIVANCKLKPMISNLLLNKLESSSIEKGVKPDWIFLHEKNSHLPEKTAKWLKLIKYNLYHHVRIDYQKDWERLIRFICGKPVALVLGGGGLRSWAHLGAIKAILEHDIPIDILGGTSAGSIVAGYYALHGDFGDPPTELQELAEITRHSVTFSQATWPAISLFSGKGYTLKLKKMFKKIRIENLWVPCFFVSSNLSNNTQVISRTGFLWKAIRSSTSVPAIFPPVVMRGQLHLDGGILNNLPVDVMRKYIGSKATIIAVELTHHHKDTNYYNFPTMLPFWKTFLAKTKIIYRNFKFPNFFDTFLNALLAGSSAKQEENSLAVNILISPDLSQYRLLGVRKNQEQELIELGYQSAQAAIAKWQRKNHGKFSS